MDTPQIQLGTKINILNFGFSLDVLWTQSRQAGVAQNLDTILMLELLKSGGKTSWTHFERVEILV